MKLHELAANDGARKTGTRRGRGEGSGLGKNSGTGHKGQRSRGRGKIRLGFEGGQNPLNRRLPKRGFRNPYGTEYAIVNVKDLNRFEDGTHVNPALLVESGLVKKEYAGVKILGNGELTKKLTVEAHKFSQSALAAIGQAGGEAKVIEVA
ncbi:MAG: 50S ribosomal protein L15 [Bacilli bacterium]|nr:50S ribosomal protein L15 [Bacilli bacterium]MDD3388968.1 50S ribosomal protein L15 [Bacilli bacterium]MDD4344407.1 50S ribosomal protein L15 [Bacilli bacterium]MDD4520689.1 50S ribosomal protein L15 [Bacilli bacterium]MDY0399336.1 50S ribosomal protein L15 [Bacilli bacterium]